MDKLQFVNLILEQVNLDNNYAWGIVPTLLVPLSVVMALLSTFGGTLAMWFGIRLKSEGPQKFFEVLKHRKTLLILIGFSLFSFTSYRAIRYFKNYPRFITTIKYQHKKSLLPSEQNYELENQNGELWHRPFQYSKIISPGEFQKTHRNFSISNVKNTQLPKGSFRSLLVMQKSIFMSSMDGYVYELDSQNLGLKRKFFVGTPIVTRPIIYKNLLIVGEGTHETHHARIYGFDLRTGHLKFTYQTLGHTEGQPAIFRSNNIDYLIVVSGIDGVHALNPDDFTLRWKLRVGHIDASPVFENGFLYLGTGSEKDSKKESKEHLSYGYKIEIQNGKIHWKKELPMSNWMNPIITHDSICFSLGEIYFKTENGIVNCLDKQNGTQKFAQTFPSPLTGKPLYFQLTFPNQKTEEMMFVSMKNGDACSISLSERSLKWCLSHVEQSFFNQIDRQSIFSFSSLTYHPLLNVLFFATLNQGLLTLDPFSGKILHHWNISQIKNHHPNWGSVFSAVSFHPKEPWIFMGDISGHTIKLELNGF